LPGISKFLRDAQYGGEIFMNLLTDILEEKYPCQGIKEIVFITPMPYPICLFDDPHYQCSSFRCLRTNSAISAIRNYFMKRLFGVSVATTKSLSIVDAFEIVSPRIMLNENYEVVCTNHYSCAVNLDSSNGTITKMIHTPAGIAVFESLLHALLKN
jgi:hypothetical protein